METTTIDIPVIATLAILSPIMGASAEVPNLISYQGRIAAGTTNINGN